MMLQLCLKFRLTSLTINSNQGREGGKRQGMKLNWLDFHISINRAVSIRVNLGLFAWLSFFLGLFFVSF